MITYFIKNSDAGGQNTQIFVCFKTGTFRFFVKLEIFCPQKSAVYKVIFLFLIFLPSKGVF